MRRYAARHLPVHAGPAAWNRILPARSPEPPLEARTTADIVIIGAGFAGLSAARRITQIDPQASVVVLEAGEIGEAGTGRNSGFMIDLPHELSSLDYAGAGDERTLIALNRQAIAFGQDAVDAYQIDRNFFDPVGKVNGAASADAHTRNESYARHLHQLGETCEILDPQQMTEMTGSQHYRSGLYTPGTVMLQPAGYVRGLANGLSRSGITFHENSPVSGFERAGASWRVDTPEGQVSAERVILTVNGHLESFGFARRQLIHLFLYASMTPELDDASLKRLGGASRWGITPADPMGTTLRRIDTGQGGNRIITRTCATLRPGMRPSQHGLRRASAVMQRKFDTRFPQLAGMQMQYQWSGHLCLSRNHVTVVKEIDDGVFSGCVQNGLGTARGTLTGIGAAELALGVTSDITRHFTAEPAPSRLPPAPLQAIGGNAVLRWREWRARAE